MTAATADGIKAFDIALPEEWEDYARRFEFFFTAKYTRCGETSRARKQLLKFLRIEVDCRQETTYQQQVSYGSEQQTSGSRSAKRRSLLNDTSCVEAGELVLLLVLCSVLGDDFSGHAAFSFVSGPGWHVPVFTAPGITNGKPSEEDRRGHRFLIRAALSPRATFHFIL
ncbi:hypothetical protein MTO96_029453 [Rhipicephalus appendiculatus]